jgi:hypothetical protein
MEILRFLPHDPRAQVRGGKRDLCPASPHGIRLAMPNQREKPGKRTPR